MSEFLEKNRENCSIINKLLNLRHEPIALKLILPGGEVHENAYRPNADKGSHLALCQVFALSRRNGKTIYMRREDHWCWNPLIAFGHVKCEEKGDPGYAELCATIGINDLKTAEEFVANFPKLPLGKYEGLLTAPLASADFEPDLWLIYCDNGQLRALIRAIKSESGELIKSEFDAFDSCMYSVIPPLLTGQYRITLPDPGEYERALTDERNIIFSVPKEKFDEVLKSAKAFGDMGFTSDRLFMEMKDNFARPRFYNEIFKKWGLEEGEEWVFS